MKIKNCLKLLMLAALSPAIFLPGAAHAVPPPDIIFAVGSQLPQLGYLLLLGCSAAAASIAGFFRCLFWRKPEVTVHGEFSTHGGKADNREAL